jgi:hypothetical protein
VGAARHASSRQSWPRGEQLDDIVPLTVTGGIAADRANRAVVTR